MIQAFIFAIYAIIGCIVADQFGDGDLINEVLIALFWPAVAILVALYTFIFEK